MRTVYKGRPVGGVWSAAQEELRGWLKKKPLQFMETLMGLEKQFRQEVMNWRHAEHMKEVEAKKAEVETAVEAVVEGPDEAEERCEEVTERLLRGWLDVKQGELAQVGAAGRAGERGVAALAEEGGQEEQGGAGGPAEEVSG